MWGNKYYFFVGYCERFCGRYFLIIKVLSNEIMILFVWLFKFFIVIILGVCNFRMYIMVEIVYLFSLCFFE